jgi:Flp pilus assembly protein TadD
VSLFNADSLLPQAYAAQSAKDFARAAKLYEQVIAIAPHRPEAYINLGLIRQNAGALDEAERLYRRAIKLAPKMAIPYLNLGVVHVKRGEEDAALANFQQALKLEPNRTDALLNLAGVYERLGRLPEAARALDRLVELAPTDITANMGRANVLFMIGRWTDAWTSYQRRHGIFWGAGRKLPGQPWRGEDIAGKTVLLSFEQGLGEQIMFASWIPEIARAAKHLIIECEARLVALFQRSFPGVEIVPWSADWHPRVRASEIDFQAALGDPGLWLRGRFAAFPAHEGYLKPDPAQVAAHRTRYQDLAKGRRIAGLAWHSAALPFGPQKSVPKEALAPLLAREDIFWINLQHGPARGEVGAPLWTDSTIDPAGDFDPLAAQIKALDVVVSASNGTAHLAAALGRPTLLALPKVIGRHWYWFPERESNPWYPAARPFVQEREGSWDGVMERIAAALSPPASVIDRAP